MLRHTIAILSLSLCLQSAASAFIGNLPQEWERLYSQGEESLELKKYKEAEATLQSALDATGGDTDKEMTTLNALDELYEVQHNFPAEEKILLSSIQLMRSVGDYPETAVGTTFLKLASVSYYMDHLDRAEVYSREALSILRKSCGKISPDVAVALNDLGWIEFKLDSLTEAENHFRQSLYILDRAFGQKNALYGLAAKNLAQLYESIHNYRAAATWYERASKSLRSSLGAQDSLTLQVEHRWEELRTEQRTQPAVKRNSSPTREKRHGVV